MLKIRLDPKPEFLPTSQIGLTSKPQKLFTQISRVSDHLPKPTKTEMPNFQ
jgi:hypothetical protein